MKNTLTIMLMVIALTVFVLQVASVNPWPMICIYWLILTIKNVLDAKRDGAE